MSQFPLTQGEDLQPFVDKFFNLQHDLAQTRFIMHSLTTTNPIQTQEPESCTTTSVEEMLSIAHERKKNANAWIKSAMALDLSPCLSPLTSPPDPTRTPSPCARPRGACSIKRNRDSSNTNTDTHNPLLLDLEKDDDLSKWGRGSTTCAAAELASSLQDECKKMFLVYADKYLDEVDRKSCLGMYDEEMAGMMYKVKMVSEWLNLIGKKDGGDSEGEACVRVRDKIYAILLKHVEMTAMAFDRFKASI